MHAEMRKNKVTKRSKFKIFIKKIPDTRHRLYSPFLGYTFIC